MSKRLDAIEARLGAATPGPWKAAQAGAFYTFIQAEDEVIVGSEGMAGYGQDTRNAALIANAPSDLAVLLRIAKAVRACLRAADAGNAVMMAAAEEELAAAMYALESEAAQ